MQRNKRRHHPPIASSDSMWHTSPLASLRGGEEKPKAFITPKAMEACWGSSEKVELSLGLDCVERRK